MSRALQIYLSRGYVPASPDTPGAVTIHTASPLPSNIGHVARRAIGGVATVTLAPAGATGTVSEPRRDPYDMIAEGNAVPQDEAEVYSGEADVTGDWIILKTPGGHFRQVVVDALSPTEKMALGSYLGHGRTRVW